MGNKAGYKSKVDKSISTYADGVKSPVWVYDLPSKEIVYHNTASQAFWPSGDEGTIRVLENLIIKEIDKSFIERDFLVFNFLNDKINLAGNYQIVVSRISRTRLIIHFSEQEDVSNQGSPNTLVFFCGLDGEIKGKTDKSCDGRFDGIKNIAEIVNPEDREQLLSALNDSCSNDKSINLTDLEGIKDFFNGTIHIECIGGFGKRAEVVVVISESSFQNELMFEKSRAELAEEINKILKLEIAEHKITQQRLDETEVLSSTIINSSINIILTFNQDQIITEFNKKAQEITGYEREEIVGHEVDLVLQNAGSVDSVLSIVNEQGHFEGDLWCIKKDGTKFGVFAGVTLLQNHLGENQGYVCNLRDISEINLWRQKVAVTEERYRDLFENATDLIQGVRSDGTFIYTNKSWYKLLGYTAADQEELTIFDLVITKQRKGFKEHFKNILNGGDDQRQKWTLKKKDGGFLIVESDDNLKLKEGKVYSVRSVMRDITAAEKAEALAREQSAKMEAIIESGNIMFWTVNRNIKLTSFNKEYEKTIFKLYGKRPILDKGSGEPKDKFAPRDYHDFWNKKYSEVFTSGNSLFFQTKTKDQKGKIYFREIYLRPIRTNLKSGEVQEVAGTGIDITDKKLTERKINEQAYKIQTIFDSANHMIWSLDTNGKLTSFNKVFKIKLKERYGIDVEIGDSGVKIARKIKIKLNGGWQEVLDSLEKVDRLQYEVETLDHNKKRHIEDISITPIYNDDGEIVELAGLAQTITFKKAAEKKLKDQASKINAIFNSTAMLIWTVDKNMRIVAYNKVFADQYFKFLGEEVSIGSNFLKAIKSKVDPDNYIMLEKFFKAAFKGENQQFEGVLRGDEGVKKWMESFFNPIYSEHNEIKEISCLSHDITDKVLIQKQMEESIHEKEILLQEVHHRVKNNLQVISSILNLQSSYVKDENSLNILRESQNRIKSMSFIHESLYQTKDFAHIEFSDYIFSLSRNLIHSYSMTTSGIKLVTDFEKTHLSLDQAIPCGLIANELISNALKYAFVDKDEGEISVSIRDKDGQIEMEISDNGIGLPEDLDYENSDSLGLQLVYTLVDQLDARIEVDTLKGTKYLITFEKQ